MFSKVNSAGILGIEAYMVGVEADVGNGLPGFTMVGYLSPEVREARDRVQTALKNSGFQLYARKVTVNLSPADIRKDGTAYDLPIAVAVLAAFGVICQDALQKVIIAGELGLDGEIKKIHGALPIAAEAARVGIKIGFFPKQNVKEAKAAGGIQAIGVSHLKELINFLNHPEQIKEEPSKENNPEEREEFSIDFSEIRGQTVLRRATEIAVAGMHNLLYIGPPGSGKSMAARRIPTIMPRLSREESLEISKVYSVCGLLPENIPLLKKRPFRSPHHSVTPAAMAGGGRGPKPGEISLASRGVLFLDELPEFTREVLEILRQPMEERYITVSRLKDAVRFPAETMVVAAMNACPCGYFPNYEKCRCTPDKIRKYMSKISGPFLDRIDICVEASALTYEMIRKEKNGEASASIRKRIEQARKIQLDRFQGRNIYFNSGMGKKELDQFCRLGREEEEFLRELFLKGRISARGCDKLLKVSRTIADLAQEEEIRLSHLCEASGYKGLEEKYWSAGFLSEKQI